MKNNRLVIIGSGSFIASGIIRNLKKNKLNYVPINRKKIDLINLSSIKKLKRLIKKKDSIIFISANAPVKNYKMLKDNLKMCLHTYEALKEKKITYFLYVSSDAVYSDSKNLINEKSQTIPQNLHGFMHLMRENIFKMLKTKVCVVRPTLVYGINDPHNGYGPNQFIRSAQSKKNIYLFGKGEEKRDHIHVNDVGELIYKLFKIKYTGVVNLVTGKVYSFLQIAEKIKKIYKIKLCFKKRIGPMPHNGYRAFNNMLVKKIFPKHNFIEFKNWIKKKEIY